MASGCFAALYLASPGGCSRAPCPDCFVWLPVVGLSAPLFKRHRASGHASFFCLRAAFGESYKSRSLLVGYLVKREYVLNNKSKRTLMFAPESETRWRCGGGGDTGGSKRPGFQYPILPTDVERISGDTNKIQYIARKKLSVCQAGVHLKSSHSQYEHLQSL